ncbi:MAG: phospho-N-acetylmuramoyl-pentapeptide-transferase [Candidatus Dependentiae bacterium]
MIYHLSLLLKPYLSFLNVIHYVTFRSMASLLTTLCSTILFGRWFIGKSKQFFRSSAREFTPETHRAKDNMPTMGGLFIIVVIGLNSLMWCNIYDLKVWLFLLLISGFGLIGFWDDWQKIKYNRGISARLKFGLQCLIALIVVALLLATGQVDPVVCFPFFKCACVYLGILYLFWAMFIIVGCSNAVNLTDGLDGLAIGSLIPNFAVFSIISYLAGHRYLSDYLCIPFTHTDQMAVIGAILVGASLGFLWFNTYPAQIFMGDVGSLALGSALAYLALVCKQEMLLPIAGGLFVIETISVIMQVASFKLFGKKIFRMAPIHHHFELLGWPESRITARFGIISFVLCLLALMTLKLR